MSNTGEVKWFDPRKGYGFIKPEEGEDLFVHVTNLETDTKLEPGTEVQFDVASTKKGLAAQNVRLVQEHKSEDSSDDGNGHHEKQLSFAELELNEELRNSLEEAGFGEPRPIQIETIPTILEGKDLVATAPTGTGKTAAFLLPLFQMLETNSDGSPRALVLAPTHELADQITKEARLLNPGGKFNIESVYGGTDIYEEMDQLEGRVDLLVACPGRLRDHLGRNTVYLRRVKHFVLDEADRMCDMGFLPEIKKIMYRLPPDRQNLFFSATIPEPIQRLADDILSEPEKVGVGRQAPTKTISHYVVETKKNQKQKVLKKILEQNETDSVLVFCRTRNTVRNLTRKLRSEGYDACGLQGGMDQIAREATMSAFRRRKFKILVATNVAARGLDVEHISHVVNYDVPEEPDVYTHRIGRTGRSGETGDAYTLVTPRNRRDLKDIERKIGYKIERKEL